MAALARDRAQPRGWRGRDEHVGSMGCILPRREYSKSSYGSYYNGAKTY